MFKETVVYVDIETTGGSYRSSRIIEFAAIKVENNKVIDTFDTLINPGFPVPNHITRLTGIKNNDVENAPYFEDVADRIHQILSGAIFIAHHVRFDYSFIKKQLEASNISFRPRMLCSVRLSRALYPSAKGHGLEAIIKRFNIEVASRHRAYDDAKAVLEFFNIARTQHGQAVFDEAVKRQLKQLSLPPNLNDGVLSAIPDTPGVYTFLDKAGVAIYIGKSVTLRKRIMSHFTQDTKINKEMKLSLHTHNISYIETSNELEALLLESQMIKEHLPLYNRQLRRIKKMYVLKTFVETGGYLCVNIDFVDTVQINIQKNVYGVYASRMKAKRSLELIQKTYDLCPKLLNLEHSKGACFKYQLKKCRGACASLETTYEYNLRFETAFEQNKIEEWPYTNPVIFSHQSDTQVKKLVIDNWSVIGELNHEEGCEPHFKPWKSGFDVDTYKILRSYLANKTQSARLKTISQNQLDTLRI